MSWDVVARKDFADAVRSRGLWALSALFVIVFALPPLLLFYLELGQPTQTEGSTDVFIFFMKEASALLVPVIAIVVAYAAITHERESGTMKILL